MDKKTYKKRITFPVSKEDWIMISKICVYQEKSLNQLMREIVKEAIKKSKKNIDNI